MNLELDWELVPNYLLYIGIFIYGDLNVEMNNFFLPWCPTYDERT